MHHMVSQQRAEQETIDVFLVDDHRCILWGLERLIDSEGPRMRVVGKAHSGSEALEGAKRVSPHVVLLDLDLDGENGADLVPELTQMYNAKVLILTGSRDAEMRERAVLKGASGVVLKDEAAEVLIKAIERVHGGELWLDRATTAKVFTAFAQGAKKPLDPQASKIATLTPKERQTITAVITERGAKSHAIAADLHISEHTLRNHLTTIYSKLGVKNRVELVMYAMEHKLTASDAPARSAATSR